MKLIGIEKVDYTNKEGKRIIGTKLHCIYEKERVQGHATLEPIYCNDSVDCSRLNVGDDIEIYFNNFGKPIFIHTIE